MTKTVYDGQSKIFENFCKNTSIPACGYLTRHSYLERIFWIFFIFVSVLCTAIITIHILDHWTSEPVFVSLDASSRPINQVDFPAVAICNINKISKHRAEEYANHLSRHIQDRNYTDIEMLKLLQVFGNMYDLSVYGAKRFAVLQNILDVYGNLSNQQDLSAHLLALSTPCREVLLNCSWNSVAYNCSDLFQTRFTDSGFCCAFNYIRPISKAYVLSNLNKEVPKTARKFIGPGIEKGLSVTIKNNISDYFYTEIPSRGYLIKIFAPEDYPDLSSGSLKQIIVQENSEVFVKVEANTLKSQEQIRTLPINIRKCKFSDEEETVLGQYTTSNCLVTCKIISMLSLCNCVPFMLPIENGMFDEDITICSLVDIPCLNKYQDKWERYYPIQAENRKELNLENEDSLFCNCLPNCNEVNYAINANYFRYYSDDTVSPNYTRIHIFSNKAYINVYKNMLTITWYEALSSFGGIVSLFLGVSIVNLVELGMLLIKFMIFNICDHDEFFSKYVVTNNDL